MYSLSDRLIILNILHPAFNILPKLFIKLPLSINNFLNLKQILLSSLNFLIDLKFDGSLM